MKTVAPWILTVAFAWAALQGQCAQRALEAAEERLDSIRTEELAARTEAQGWRTQLVQATSELERELQGAGEREALLVAEKAEIAREVETLGARLTLVTDLYAEAQGQIVAHAEVHVADSSTSIEGGNPAMPDSITVPLDDGLLEGRVAYLPGPSEFDLVYGVHLGLTLATAEAPDGRTLVTAMAEDPRVDLRYGELLVAGPRVVQHCSFGQRATTSGFAIGAWELGKAFLSTLKP